MTAADVSALTDREGGDTSVTVPPKGDGAGPAVRARQYPLRVGVDLTEAEAASLAGLVEAMRGKGDKVLVRALRKVAHALQVSRLVGEVVPNGRHVRPDMFPPRLLARLRHVVGERCPGTGVRPER